MIRAYAMLNFMQRERDENEAILATVEDFRAAQHHYGSRAEMQQLHLTKSAQRFLQHLQDKNATNEHSAVNSVEMQRGLKLTRSRISQIVSELRNSLYDFHVVERYETETDTYDDTKRSGQRKHFYYVDGGVQKVINLASYESVVSLKDG